MSELIEKLKEVRNNGSKRQVHINLANECIKEVEALERQLAEARFENKMIKGLKADVEYFGQMVDIYEGILTTKQTLLFEKKLKEKGDE